MQIVQGKDKLIMKRDSSLVTKAAITAVGSYVPEEVLTNHDLEQMVETNDEWIRSRTGISERRIAKSPEHSTAFMAIKAAQDLCQKNNIDPASIDVVLVATITPDYQVSSTAPYVATEIGELIEHSPADDSLGPISKMPDSTSSVFISVVTFAFIGGLANIDNNNNKKIS